MVWAECSEVAIDMCTPQHRNNMIHKFFQTLTCSSPSHWIYVKTSYHYIHGYLRYWQKSHLNLQ
jgi:hypothetical protein